MDATAVSMRNALNGVQNVVKTMDDIASASRGTGVFRGTGDPGNGTDSRRDSGEFSHGRGKRGSQRELSAQALLLKGLLERFRFDNTDVQ